MSINPLFRDEINFRDLGGYKAQDGRVLKHGLIYRSGGIYLMNPEELDHFKSLGIKYILDLRTAEESHHQPDPVLNQVKMVRHSGVVFRGGEEIDFSPVGMSKIGQEGLDQRDHLLSYYTEMPFDNEAFQILMSDLENNEVPMVFHCATGKDRTGVAAMVVLTALGIPKETILQDFLLSNQYHMPTINRVLEENREKILQHPILEELLRMRTGVTEKTGKLVLDNIFNRYGSPEKYLEEEFHLTPERLSKFRDFYLD